MNSGPAAGIEAALKSSRQPWALFIPVDVPLVPAELLRLWAEQTLSASARGPSGSYLTVEREAQPAFCMLSRQSLPAWTDALEHGERRLELLLGRARVPGRYGAAPVDALQYAPEASPMQMRRWFSNVNTPQDLEEAESLLQVGS
jgi:molybdopterin-guanine dinucleotide biosynthesis protein A